MSTLTDIIANSTGLSYDNKDYICSGLFEGYRMSVTCKDTAIKSRNLFGNANVIFHFSITNGGKSLDDTMFTELVETSENIKSVKTEGYMLHVQCENGGKSGGESYKEAARLAILALQEIVSFFKKNNFYSCCGKCGSTDVSVDNYLFGENHICLCNECFEKKSVELQEEGKNRNLANVLRGMLGALLISVVVIAVMVLFGNHNSEFLVALLISVLISRVYIKFRKGMTETEKPFLVFFTIIVEWLNYQAMYAIVFTQQHGGSFWMTYFRMLFSLPSSYLEKSMINKYWIELFFVIIVAIVCVIRESNSIINKIAQSKILVKINNK